MQRWSDEFGYGCRCGSIVGLGTETNQPTNNSVYFSWLCSNMIFGGESENRFRAWWAVWSWSLFPYGKFEGNGSHLPGGKNSSGYPSAWISVQKLLMRICLVRACWTLYHELSSSWRQEIMFTRSMSTHRYQILPEIYKSHIGSSRGCLNP